MLEDESCRFLAVDFDKDGWNDDVAAFVETCRRFDLEVTVERSRSGNGAHAWLFFRAVETVRPVDSDIRIASIAPVFVL